MAIKTECGCNTPSSGCSRWDYRAIVKGTAKRIRRTNDKKEVRVVESPLEVSSYMGEEKGGASVQESFLNNPFQKNKMFLAVREEVVKKERTPAERWQEETEGELFSSPVCCRCGSDLVHFDGLCLYCLADKAETTQGNY